jgi:Ca-activated chloride channel family protein
MAGRQIWGGVKNLGKSWKCLTGSSSARPVRTAVGVASLLVILAAACSSKHPSGSASTETTQKPPANAFELVFVYGSEKEKWINEVTGDFNRGEHKTASGKPIFVRAVPMGSGESVDAILSGRVHAHLASPASAAFITLGNAQSRAKTGKDFIGPTENLVLSPVVIAMWKPMAEALGWGKKAVGWADVLALARNPAGWEAYGYPQWGRFKFGHTHPEYSNSGLISLVAEVYAATGKTRGLSVADVDRLHTGEFLAGIEQSVVHYGSSTGFFGRKMFASGPQYLSAAVLYESMVVESYTQTATLPFPVVAIYPKEGTFWSDHPVGIVQREWVTPEHQEAAKIYIKYLIDKPQQEKALNYGFRPASVDVPVTTPIDAAHGVDPAEPKTTLEVPSAEVIDAILKSWRQKKKDSDVVLVLDTSGSMNDGKKIQHAREGARQLVNLLSDSDTFALLPFNSDVAWAIQDAVLKDGRAQALSTIDSLFAQGGTRLYDSIDLAYQHCLAGHQNENKILAVVVLTDGADTESAMTLKDLMSRIRYDGETHTIHVFTIAYGRDAKKDILTGIADATQAKSYEGTPQNIVDVFRDVSTFF